LFHDPPTRFRDHQVVTAYEDKEPLPVKRASSNLVTQYVVRAVKQTFWYL